MRICARPVKKVNVTAKTKTNFILLSLLFFCHLIIYTDVKIHSIAYCLVELPFSLSRNIASCVCSKYIISVLYCVCRHTHTHTHMTGFSVSLFEWGFAFYSVRYCCAISSKMASLDSFIIVFSLLPQLLKIKVFSPHLRRKCMCACVYFSCSSTYTHTHTLTNPMALPWNRADLVGVLFLFAFYFGRSLHFQFTFYVILYNQFPKLNQQCLYLHYISRVIGDKRDGPHQNWHFVLSSPQRKWATKKKRQSLRAYVRGGSGEGEPEVRWE